MTDKPYNKMSQEEILEEMKARFTMPTELEAQQKIKLLIENGMKEAEAIGLINRLMKKRMKK